MPNYSDQKLRAALKVILLAMVHIKARILWIKRKIQALIIQYSIYSTYLMLVLDLFLKMHPVSSDVDVCCTFEIIKNNYNTHNLACGSCPQLIFR